jgi:GH24 family phage-related lysozyme (muramidase)
VLRFQARQTVETVFEPPSNCLALTRYFYSPEERGDPLLLAQLRAAERKIARTIVRPLHPWQHEALLCLVSDLVAGLAVCPSVSFEKSFLVSALNKGMFQIAAAEFHAFCYAQGKVQARLWEKRRAERYLFTRGHLLFE